MEQTSLTQVQITQQPSPTEQITGAVQEQPTMVAAHTTPIGLSNDRVYQPAQYFGAAIPQMLYPDLARANGLNSSRSRTAFTSGIGLLQHQRVHDADSAEQLEDPEDRLLGYYDPNQSVVFKTGIHERSGRRNRRRQQLKPHGNTSATQATDSNIMSEDVFETVLRVVQALKFVESHPLGTHRQAAATALTPQLGRMLKTLVLTAATPPVRCNYRLQRVGPLALGSGRSIGR